MSSLDERLNKYKSFEIILEEHFKNSDSFKYGKKDNIKITYKKLEEGTWKNLWNEKAVYEVEFLNSKKEPITDNLIGYIKVTRYDNISLEVEKYTCNSRASQKSLEALVEIMLK